MFGRFTVLFVGYSHNDPVMNYLARGLYPDSRHRRFALVPEGEEAHWNFLDIRPITYPLRQAVNPHVRLEEGLHKWSAHCQHSFLDNVRRVIRNAKTSPPKDPEEGDFMEACFKDSDLLKQFVETCRNPEWLKWIHEKGLLRPLFTPDAVLAVCDGLIAWWIKRHLLATSTPLLLELVQQLGPNDIHPVLCNEIFSALVFLKEEPGVAEVFNTWVVVLLAQPHNRLPAQSWARILAACDKDKSLFLIGSLFERATQLHVEITKSWSFSAEQSDNDPTVDFGVKIEHDTAYPLDEGWRIVLRPNLSNLAPILEPIVTQRLMQANGMLRAVKHASVSSDPISLRRRSIERHSQDQHPDDFEFLIDVARDIVALYQEQAPFRAEALIKTWLDLDVVLLKRLAVHAIARQPTYTPLQKVMTCVDMGLLFELYVRTEVFFLLKHVYTDLSSDERLVLFRAIESSSAKKLPDDLDDESVKRVIFKVIGWISQNAPACSIANSKFAEQQTLHPEFALGPHPDMLMWSSGFGFKAIGEGVDFDAILKKPAADFLNTIVSAPSSGEFENRRDNFCWALQPLMTKDVDWAIDCQRAARELGIQDDDIWQSISMGWRDAKPTVEQWSKVFVEITNSVTPNRFFFNFPDTLEAWAKRKDDVVPEALLGDMDQLALRCWRNALQNDSVSSEPSHDWLSNAINHAGGKYAEYLLLRLDAVRKSSGDTLNKIHEPFREAFIDIIHGNSGSAEMGRVIIAAQVRWLHAIDSAFAKAEIIPLFNWYADERKAEQCWHGFLDWGQWSTDIFELLLSMFTEAVRRIASGDNEESDDMGARVAGHLAAVCIWYTSDPMADDWLLTCIRSMSEANRGHFALEIRNQLEAILPEERARLWVGWMSKYWKTRTSGVPPLSAREAMLMFGWAMFPQQHIVEAVELALETATLAEFKYAYSTHELNDSNLVNNYPVETAKLWLAFLEKSPNWYNVGNEDRSLWAKLMKANVSHILMDQIRSHLVRHGWKLGDFE